MFPLFEDLKITTQTYVVYTNLTIPLVKLYNLVACTPVKQPYHKKFNVSKETLRDGDIVYIQFKNVCKGFNKPIKDKQMLNVVTIIVKYNDKLYNVKIPQSGKIQLTGCRDKNAVIFIIGVILRLLDTAQVIECYFVCVMSNVGIEIPFQIDRDKLHQYINQKTEHISLLEKSVGYVGVNVKIKSEKESKEDTVIDKITYMPDGSYVSEPAKFSDAVSAGKKYKKDMYNSFLIFESGKTIMSGCASYVNRKDAYEKFVRIIEDAREEFELVTPEETHKD